MAVEAGVGAADLAIGADSAAAADATLTAIPAIDVAGATAAGGVGAGVGAGVVADAGLSASAAAGTSAFADSAIAGGSSALPADAAAGLSANANSAIAAGGLDATGAGASQLAADGVSFLPATGAGSATPLGASTAGTFGVGAPASAGIPNAASGAGIGFDPSLGTASTAPAGGGFGGAATTIDTTAPTTAGGAGSGLMDWATNPKNLPTEGLLGLSALNALSTPQLPGAAKTALGTSTAGANQAQAIIQSGGTNTPEWAGQKASIDASINQQLQQQTEALKQNAANSGQSGMVVQQQIDSLTQTLETQRQQLYAQAQQQNVSNAVSELTGSNATLGSIANMQLGQSQQAQQQAMQTAELALLLSSRG